MRQGTRRVFDTDLNELRRKKMKLRRRMVDAIEEKKEERTKQWKACRKEMKTLVRQKKVQERG